MPGSRGVPLGAGLQIYPISPAQRVRKEKAKAQKALMPLLAEIVEDLADKVEPSGKKKDDTPALRGKSKLAAKVARMRELTEVIKGNRP